MPCAAPAASTSRTTTGFAVAICTNEKDPADRSGCLADAASTRDEENALCREQLLGRQGACAALGEGRYDPEFRTAAVRQQISPG